MVFNTFGRPKRKALIMKKIFALVAIAFAVTACEPEKPAEPCPEMLDYDQLSKVVDCNYHTVSVTFETLSEKDDHIKATNARMSELGYRELTIDEMDRYMPLDTSASAPVASIKLMFISK